MSWKYIMVHHSLTKDGEVVDTLAIRRYHMMVRGWSDVGYHRLIELVLDDYVPMIGRPLNMAGAHCKEARMNHLAVGICFVGNYDLAPPPDEMLEVGAEQISHIMRWFDIPVENIIPHNLHANYKTCPGSKFPMDRLREMVCLKI